MPETALLVMILLLIFTEQTEDAAFTLIPSAPLFEMILSSIIDDPSIIRIAVPVVPPKAV